MNSCNFIGRVGRDAATRKAGESQATSFPVAVDVGYGQNKTTLWLDCTIWGERGLKVVDYIRAGDRIGVHGEMSLREYDKNGEKKTQASLRVVDVTLLGNKDDKRSTGGGSDSRERQSPPARAQSDEFQDDQIPFITNRGAL